MGAPLHLGDLSADQASYLQSPEGIEVRKIIVSRVIQLRQRLNNGGTVSERFVLRLREDFPVTLIPALVAYAQACLRQAFGEGKSVDVQPKIDTTHQEIAPDNDIHSSAQTTPRPQKTLEEQLHGSDD